MRIWFNHTEKIMCKKKKIPGLLHYQFAYERENQVSVIVSALKRLSVSTIRRCTCLPVPVLTLGDGTENTFSRQVPLKWGAKRVYFSRLLPC